MSSQSPFWVDVWAGSGGWLWVGELDGVVVLYLLFCVWRATRLAAACCCWAREGRVIKMSRFCYDSRFREVGRQHVWRSDGSNVAAGRLGRGVGDGVRV